MIPHASELVFRKYALETLAADKRLAYLQREKRRRGPDKTTQRHHVSMLLSANRSFSSLLRQPTLQLSPQRKNRQEVRGDAALTACNRGAEFQYCKNNFLFGQRRKLVCLVVLTFLSCLSFCFTDPWGSAKQNGRQERKVSLSAPHPCSQNLPIFLRQ